MNKYLLLLLLFTLFGRAQDTSAIRLVDLNEIILWAPKENDSLLAGPMAIQRVDFSKLLARSSGQNLNDAVKALLARPPDAE